MNAPTDHVKSRAFIVYNEFGPSLRIPRHERLCREFPEIADENIEAWLKEFKEMDALTWKLAEEIGKSHLRQSDFYSSFSKAYPWLNREGLDKACNRCGYYMWHEGFGGYQT